MNLRYLAATAIDGEENEIKPDTKKTAAEVVEAYEKFYLWWEDFVEKELTLDQQNQACFAIWGIVHASKQACFEDGFRAGARLLCEVMQETIHQNDLESYAHRGGRCCAGYSRSRGKGLITEHGLT